MLPLKAKPDNKLRPRPRGAVLRAPGHQSGAALLVFLSLMVVTASYFLVSALNRVNMTIGRDQTTQDALAQAKMALIGRAAADENRPGSLPCPDTDNDGDADMFAGNDCPNYVGRLPWKTLKLGDLRDANGERLWYALSPAFRDNNSAQPINSNTLGQLTLTGSVSASEVIAIVFAPGPAIGGQNRISANVNDVSHYLEGENNTPPATPPSAFDKTFASSGASGSFNDRVLILSHADLFAVVENVVERRMANEIAPRMRDYYDPVTGWTAFPYPAAFDPVASTFVGNKDLLEGLPPVSTSSSLRNWSSPSCGLIPGGAGSCVCSLATPESNLSCTYIAIASATIDIDVKLNSAGFTFIERPTTGLMADASSPTVNITEKKSDGSARVNFKGQISPPLGTVVIKRPAFLSLLTSSTYQWYFLNDWHRLSYYAISSDVVFGKSGSCTGSCLTINNAPAPNDNKRAVLVLAGRAIGAQDRQANPTLVASYFEGQNQSTGDRIFEQNRRTANFNDRAVVVSP